MRFRDRMLLFDDEDETWGIIEPLIAIQDRLNETTWEMLVAQYFTAFVQRYVMGWMPKSEQEALRQVASDTWFFGSAEVKVGQFEAADLKGYLEARAAAIRTSPRSARPRRRTSVSTASATSPRPPSPVSKPARTASPARSRPPSVSPS